MRIRLTQGVPPFLRRRLCDGGLVKGFVGVTNGVGRFASLLQKHRRPREPGLIALPKTPAGVRPLLNMCRVGREDIARELEVL